jgi:hypothetical protein
MTRVPLDRGGRESPIGFRQREDLQARRDQAVPIDNLLHFASGNEF